MKKQTLANIAVVAAFLFTLNLAAQPRGPQKDWDKGPGGKPAVKAGPAARPAPVPGPAARPAPAPGPAARPAPAPGPAARPAPAPGPAARPAPAPGPAVRPAPAPGPAAGPTRGSAVGPGPKPGPAPAPHVHPAPAPAPHVHPAPAPAPHVDHPHGGFFYRLFAPAPPRPHGYRTFPHRHPSSKFTFLWYDYLPGGKVYELTDYVIYECRFCHLVHYSPVIPANALCPAAPGQIHSYQILGYYGDLAFRCATCGVTINSTAIPNVGYCGTQYHVWQQLLEY